MRGLVKLTFFNLLDARIQRGRSHLEFLDCSEIETFDIFVSGEYYYAVHDRIFRIDC